MQNFYHVFSFTHIGHRDENQDNFVVLSDQNSASKLIVVADGMGGHIGGKIAAEAIVNVAQDLWDEAGEITDPKAFLTTLIDTAQSAIIQLRNDKYPDPQSTICAFYLNDQVAISAHLGDSRVIQIKNGNVLKRTTDHSKAQLLALEGKIKESEIANHTLQNALFRNLGTDSTPRPEFETWDVEGSTFIICTDGFWELFPAEILSSIANKIDSSAELQKVVTQAIMKSSEHDNATAVILKPDLNTSAGQTKKQAPLFTAKKALYFSLLLASLTLIIFATFLIFNSLKDDDGVVQRKIDTELSPQDKKAQAQLESTSRTTIIVDSTEKSDVIQKTEEHLRKAVLLGENDTLIEHGRTEDIDETTIIRTQQHYKGIPIYGAQAILILDNNSKELKVDAKTAGELKLDIKPELSAETAIKMAQSLLNSELIQIGKAKLVIYNKETYRLAWQYLIETDSGGRETLILDATSAQILLKIASNLPPPEVSNDNR